MSEKEHIPTTPQSTPEMPEIAAIELFRRPVSELPEVGQEVIMTGEEFWSRSALRPGEEGPNYNNMPAFGFGIYYDGEEAVLTVPSLDYVNHFVDAYNPGGFHFEDVATGLTDKGEFLNAANQKRFLVSGDREGRVAILDATSRCVEPSNERRVIETNYYEHDRVDHFGLAAIAGSEAQKVASLIHVVLNQPEYVYVSLINETGAVDAWLTELSDYAMLPSQPTTEFDKKAKISLRKSINATITHYFGFNLARTRTTEDKEQVNRLIQEHVLDFDVIDQKIAELQALPATTTSQIVSESVPALTPLS